MAEETPSGSLGFAPIILQRMSSSWRSARDDRALGIEPVEQHRPLLRMADQVRRAVAWVYKNAASFGGDPNRLYLSGHSSGGHLAGVVLVTDWEKDYGVPKEAVGHLLSRYGALACEAVVFFDPDRAAQFAFQRKRGGHTLSKGRFLGAQMEAYLTDGLWLTNARRANAAASSLAEGLLRSPGVR